MPSDLPPLRDVMRRHDLLPKKSLGQNFLLDGELIALIVRQAGDVSQLNIVEIGPGPGGLTRALLLAGAKQVFAIEKDRRCVAALSELAEGSAGRLAIIEADALSADLLSLCPAPRAIVANLPYNIATELLFRWLEDIHAQGNEAYTRLVLMFQKEVADRIAAPPGGKAYGKLSVMTQWLCEAETCFDIPPEAFTPPPKVTSTVIRLTPRAAPLCPVNKDTLNHVVSAAFGQRRKMLRGALKVLGIDAEALLHKASIDPTRRAEALSVEEFCRLAQAFDKTR